MKKNLFRLLLIISITNNLLADLTRDDTNEIVIDSATNLMWQDNSDVIDENMTKYWNEAINYCEELSLGGYSDWRLPNFNELYSIIDLTKYNPAINNKFQNIDSLNYWSSTTSNLNSKAWLMTFSDGTSFPSGKDSKFNSPYVRCVRDN